ncbi:S8 family serine peptidase, partial [bacterium]|nr:S8 family serine peptidase [bacterium]
MNIKKRYIVIIFLFGFCSFLKAQYLKTDKYEEQKTSIIVKFKKENILNRDVLNRVLRSPGTHTLSVANTGSLQGTTFDAVLKDTVDATYNHIKLFQDPSGLTTQSVGSNYYIVDIASGDAEKVLKIFNQDASIEYAEVNQIISLPKDVNHPDGFSKTGFSSSNFEVQSSDPGFSNQYYYSGLNIPVVMEYTGQDEILVAIVDSGIDIYHEDLDGKIAINGNEVLNGIDDDFNGVIDDIYGYNFSGYFEGGGSNSITDGFGHGTHISGIIASKVGNGVGIKGINPNVKLLAVPFLNRFGFGTQVDAARAIQYAVDRGAKIINCSWGYTSDSALMRESFEYAFERGVIVIAAVGNGSSTKLEYPAAYDESIGVGSTNLDGNRSSFSNYGEQLDFLTYGEKIYSLLPNNRYAYKSGSSQSTAIVTGLVSGLLSKYPDLLQEEVIEILKYSSVNPENSSKT